MDTDQAAKTLPLPPYPEMILAAIEALDDKNESNKSAISEYIEDKYGDLPLAHALLLTAHLARMKESRELIFLKNRYFRADAPPKRGRGRPPKPKDPNAPPPKPSSPHPRGRPPKAKDPLADTVAKATFGLPKARGRPSKKAKTALAPAAAGFTSVKRGQGRPPKMILAAIEALDDKNGSNKSAISEYIEDKYGDLPLAHALLLTAHLARMKESRELIFLKNRYFRADAPPKRGRGRPPKPKDPNAPPPKPSSPRPRGRPPKAKDPLADTVAKATFGLPKARSRPSKKAKTALAPAAAGFTSVKRGQGRPPKVCPAVPSETVTA